MVPIQNANSDYARKIQLSLIIDNHETNLLIQLNRMYQYDLLKSSKDQSVGRNQTQANPANTNPLKMDEHNNNTNALDQTLIDFNNLSNLGKISENRRQNNQNQGSDDNYHFMILPFQLNSISLDRYAYTSNCPTKYTDPSGHCDVSKALGGVAITLIGIGIGGFGVGVAGLGIMEVSVAAPTIVGIFIGLHEIGVGGLIASSGYLIITKGIEAIIESDCLTKTDSDNSNS